MEKKKLSHDYAVMMSSEAWKDLVQYAEDERSASIKRVDDKDASDLNIGTVCEERGMRKGMHKLLQHAEQRLEGI